jgi:phosphohistidine phosphatase
MGAWIGEHVGVPDEILVSPARRTRQTWGLVSTALGIPREAADFNPGVYEATWWDLLDLIRRCPEQVRTLMLLGHNPTMEDLTDELAGSGDADALQQARVRFPTGSVAVLDSDSPWSKWGSDCAFLRAFATP